MDLPLLQVWADNILASFPGFSLFTVDVYHVTKGIIQKLCWARATWILFVVLHKRWENKFHLPMKRNTCFSNQQEHFSQNWWTPVGKLFIDLWWQSILSGCLDRWKRCPKPFNLTYGNESSLEQVCYIYDQILTTDQRGHIMFLLYWLYLSFSGVWIYCGNGFIEHQKIQIFQNPNS